MKDSIAKHAFRKGAKLVIPGETSPFVVAQAIVGARLIEFMRLGGERFESIYADEMVKEIID